MRTESLTSAATIIKTRSQSRRGDSPAPHSNPFAGLRPERAVKKRFVANRSEIALRDFRVATEFGAPSAHAAFVPASGLAAFGVALLGAVAVVVRPLSTSTAFLLPVILGRR